MKLKTGERLLCMNTIYNYFQQPLFKQGDVYDVLNVDEYSVTLNHILYANEYASFPIGFISRNFNLQKEK